MFGLGKRAALIKELVEARFVLQGQDSLDARLHVKSLGSFAAMSLPKATILTILECAIKAHKQGTQLSFALDRIERQRRIRAADPVTYREILQFSTHDPAESLVAYCKCRINCESKNVSLTLDEIQKLIGIA